MIKFNEEAKRASINGALALRSNINKIVDTVCEKGYKNICWLGIGGTYASSMQVVVHMKEFSAIESFVENASEYLTTGNKRIDKDTLIIFSSVTGNTEEMVKAIKYIKDKVGSTIIAFIDVENTELAKMANHVISYRGNEQLKFFMIADRLMYKNNEFNQFDSVYEEFDNHLANAIIEVEKKADAFGLAFAEKHKDDEIHYFTGAGNQWGATYSYAMCYWEEQHWIKTKSIHASEFFHGTLEIITRDVPITVFVGEDSQRTLAKRVADFLPRICANYTIIDTADYELKGISSANRGMISHLIMMTINTRIDAHLEKINCHPTEIRRYYRRLEY